MIEPTSSKWFAPVLGEDSGISWNVDGHRLVELLRREVEFHFTLRGWIYQSQGVDQDGLPIFQGYCLTSESMRTELILLPGENLRVFIGGQAIEDVQEEQESWIKALAGAASKLRGEDPAHEWWCAIGTTAGPAHRLVFLSQAGQLSPELTFSAAEVLYQETVEQSSRPSLSGITLHEFYPIRVQGVSRGLNFDDVITAATEEANRVAALFSVVFDHHWRIYESVRPKVGQIPPLPHARMGSDLEGMGSGVGLRESVEPPTWLENAWRRINEDEILLRSLVAHHHAMSLEVGAPSYALVAFIGAIECLGEKIDPPEVCDCCADCTAVVGASRRFRRALREVLSASEAKRLMRLYSRRSKTAHEGRLQGGEELAGGFTISMDVFRGRTSREEFDHDLREAHKVSRKLLMHILSREDNLDAPPLA